MNELIDRYNAGSMDLERLFEELTAFTRTAYRSFGGEVEASSSAKGKEVNEHARLAVDKREKKLAESSS